LHLNEKNHPEMNNKTGYKNSTILFFLQLYKKNLMEEKQEQITEKLISENRIIKHLVYDLHAGAIALFGKCEPTTDNKYGVFYWIIYPDGEFERIL
jgi:hypothetical protein